MTSSPICKLRAFCAACASPGGTATTRVARIATEPDALIGVSGKLNISGVPAFAAAAAALQCELTVPEVAQSVVLTRVGGRASRMPEAEKLATFAATGATLVIHLAVHALEAIVKELTPFYGADCPAAVVVQATSPDERVLRGTLADISAKVAVERIERTALILVGRALGAEDFRDSALYDADYRRRFRGGAS